MKQDPSTPSNSCASSTWLSDSSASLRKTIAERSAQLARIAQELKSELFGIDDVIDRVMQSIRAWYVLPQIIQRPVIICLWGLTGTGKTQLTRSLAQKLGFYSRFVEVQMDGFSNDTARRSSTISGMLADTIVQGEAGILVLDEFQRFRTIDAQGKDVRVERYMDVWALLSDGRLAPSLSFMEDLQMSLASSQYQEDRRRHRAAKTLFDPGGDESMEDDPSEHGQSNETQATRASEASETAGSAQPRRFSLSPYEAKELKSSLKLNEPLTEIMTWSSSQVMQRLQAFCDNPAGWETDYSKLLIFVCGNLDEMYAQVATRVEDCDSDADVFHAVTRKLSVIDVKRALTHRFKPEQIARLGNTHIVYPSFNRATFERLVATTTQRYLSDVQTTSGLQFKVSDALLKQLYDNGVFPTQGTRPLFSTIHSILSGALVHFTLWALEIGALAGEQVLLDVTIGDPLYADVDVAGIPDSADQGPAHDYVCAELVATCQGQTTRIPILLEILQLKERRDSDFRALLAVHEAGHGLMYALLFRVAPLQINIHVAAYSGGFNTLIDRQAKTSADMINGICVYLAGRAAEQMIFGKDRVTSGSQNDLQLATSMAAEYVRFLGFGARLSRTDQDSSEENNVNTDMQASNEAIETLLKTEFQRAQDLLRQHKSVLLAMARALQTRGTLTRQEVMDWVGLSTEQPNICSYSAMLESFEESMP
jgi:hypothetical protein